MEREEISFKTDKGTSVKLAWQKKEYRAYVLKSWGKWEPLGYGAALTENLIEYLKKNV
jgi:hypothetical protein